MGGNEAVGSGGRHARDAAAGASDVLLHASSRRASSAARSADGS